MPDPFLSLRAVDAWQGGVQTLRAVSLDVAHGEFLTLLGPAGAGKTSLLRLLAGERRKAAGGILCEGEDLDRRPADRRGFALVAAEDALLRRLDVRDNLALAPALRRMPVAARRHAVDRVLDLLRLGEVATHVPAGLSAADRFRIRLGRALLGEPRLLLLDDPLHGLDPGEREDALVDLRRVHDWSGVTTLLATREPAAALSLSHRVAVLRQGRLEQVAAPAALYEDPASGFVARCTGDINLLPGTLGAVEDDLAPVRLDCGLAVEARPAEGLREGDRVVVCVRPERIAHAPVSAAELGGNALPATLIDMAYRGDHVRLRLLIGSGVELLVKRPAAAGLAGLAPGRSGAVAWQPHHALAVALNETG